MKNMMCIILAAGQGKRMQQSGSDKQKVLVELKAKPLLGHVLEVVYGIGVRKVAVVIGHQVAGGIRVRCPD